MGRGLPGALGHGVQRPNSPPRSDPDTTVLLNEPISQRQRSPNMAVREPRIAFGEAQGVMEGKATKKGTLEGSPILIFSFSSVAISHR